MAAKKTPTKSKKSTSKVKVLTNKSEFIRQNSKLPVKEIIAKAAKAGVGDISAAFCYTILSEFRKKQGQAPSRAKATGGSEVGNRRAPKASSSLEQTLIEAVVDMGGITIHNLLQEVIKKVKAQAGRK
jgi:hypothetical protein